MIKVKILRWDARVPTGNQAIYAYTGFGNYGSTVAFGIKAIAGGAAYELTNPLPGKDRYHEADLEEMKKVAQTVYDEFLQAARQVLTDDEAMRNIGNVTRFDFPGRLRAHACPGPCDPRDEDHNYVPETIVVECVGDDRWIVTRPDMRHATHDQEWELPPTTAPYDPKFLYGRDEALEQMECLTDRDD